MRPRGGLDAGPGRLDEDGEAVSGATDHEVIEGAGVGFASCFVLFGKQDAIGVGPADPNGGGGAGVEGEGEGAERTGGLEGLVNVGETGDGFGVAGHQNTVLSLRFMVRTASTPIG